MKTGRITALLLLISILSLAGDGVFLAYGKPDNETSLTNPLLNYRKIVELRPFKYKIEYMISQYKAQGRAMEIAVYFRSFSDGAWFGVDEKVKFCPASLLKVPKMIAYFKLAEKDPGILQKKIKYQISDTGATQKIKFPVPGTAGNYYSVDELIRFMIEESDNNSSVLLGQNIDRVLINKTIKDLGVVIEGAQVTSDFASLKSLVGMYRILYNASYLNREMSEKALRLLAHTAFKDGIVAGVPPGITVAHKFGERGVVAEGVNQIHDIGIVYHLKQPYLIGIMTKGRDIDDLIDIVQNISKLIYDEVDQQLKSEGKTDFGYIE